MSTIRSAHVRVRRRYSWVPPSVTALAALLSFLVIGAIQGGMAMVTNPVSPLGMSLDYLEKAPVADYFWPGVFLLVIAAASLLSILGLLFRWEWRWAARIETAVGYRWPWLAAVAIGSTLLVFELIELFMIPFHPVMHPLLIAGSLAIVGLSLLPTARAFLRAQA